MKKRMESALHKAVEQLSDEDKKVLSRFAEEFIEARQSAPVELPFDQQGRGKTVLRSLLLQALARRGS